MNILDVWFDSGSSHEAVLSVRPELTWPADIYLEGSDQHRGWFQSSLLVGLGTRGRAAVPRGVTHGFIVADDGRKMSKSLGNSIEPQDIIKQSGADILRLWVSMSDYTQEIRLSKEILARAVEAYRKIRNTLRYLRREPVRLRSGRRSRAARPARGGRPLHPGALRRARPADPARRTTEYDYGTIFQALNAFATVDLSAFYADVSKDRLYTFAARSRERRSAQTAMYLMADGLTRLMAPILSFTADELWRFLPGAREESVHLALFPGDAELAALVDRELLERWTKLHRAPRTGAGGDRAAPEEQADRQLAAGEGRPVGHASGARAARALRARPADAVHRVRGRAAAARRPTSRRRGDRA